MGQARAPVLHATNSPSRSGPRSCTSTPPAVASASRAAGNAARPARGSWRGCRRHSSSGDFLLLDPLVTLLLQLERELFPARLDDAAVGQHVHEVGNEIR